MSQRFRQAMLVVRLLLRMTYFGVGILSCIIVPSVPSDVSALLVKLTNIAFCFRIVVGGAFTN